MIIGCCGFGATGSSVVTDLLSEYEGIQVYDDFEFTLSYKVDGLEDLEYHLMHRYAKNISGDYAIKRFLNASKCYMTPLVHKPCDGKLYYNMSKDFVNKLIQVEYKGVDTVDVLSGNIIKNVFALAFKKVIIPNVFERILRKPVYSWPCRTMYFSINPINFYSAAKEYTDSILKSMGANTEGIICLDQPFEGNAPENSFNFFNDPYAIVVDRDPRDLFLAGKYSRDPNFKFCPRNNVDEFIIYYKNMRRNIKNHDKVLRVHFEDFIYEYNYTVNLIEKFLKLDNKKHKEKIFDPNKSINNTQLIRLHPNEIENIKKIERELKDYLYPFEKYGTVSFSGKPFDGAARKAFEQ